MTSPEARDEHGTGLGGGRCVTSPEAHDGDGAGLGGGGGDEFGVVGPHQVQ